MKIRKIELFNIGPYVDVNTFEISIENNRNIVLIGGKNGAGKTTFFKSIKTCLYGSRAWGYEAPGKDYFSIINGLINNQVQYSDDAKAYIEIVLYFNDGKEEIFYNIKREWTKAKRGINEKLTISKNGIELNEEMKQNFNSYLLSIIPPDMFNFYFFDGEAIADYFLGNDGGKNFRNAFLKLYGLDTLSIMIDNFDRHSSKDSEGEKEKQRYQEAKQQLEYAESNLVETEQKIKDAERRIDAIQVELASLKESYVKEGGVSSDEWKRLNAELLKEESKREDINRKLKEIANNYLPFIIVKDDLKSLLKSLELEQDIQKKKYVKETLSKKAFMKKLDKYFSENEIGIAPSNIVNLICAVLEDDNKELKYDFSPNQIQKIISQIEERLAFSKEIVVNLTNEIRDSLNDTKRLRERLTNSSIDGYEEYIKKLEGLEHTIVSTNCDLDSYRQEKFNLENDIVEVTKTFEKEKAKYEALLKSKSITDISSRAVAAYSLLEEKLIIMQSIALQKEFVSCFSSIINKENFVDGIVIDKNINVIPYKFVDVKQDEIENYLKEVRKNSFLDFFEEDYLMIIEDAICKKTSEVRLPAPITSEFSKGERQVYIMSIYLALLKTSNNEVPFFIDTPFARVDSDHREKLVTEFFKGVSNQLFVLSTDEEIVGKHKELIDDCISNEFLLQSNNYGVTEIRANEYFGEKNDF